jgi:hypothetical protein
MRHLLFAIWIALRVNSMAYGFVVAVPNVRSISTSTSTSTAGATTVTLLQASSNTPTVIDFQSDSSQFGRGEMHLSAILNEGDVVVYQKGTWMVDGVVVGDDTQPPSFQYCQIETIQLVWTHNCEHGVLRGLALETEVVEGSNKEEVLAIVEPLESVEFGPEQLVARLPVEWNAEGTVGTSLVDLEGGALWKVLE